MYRVAHLFTLYSHWRTSSSVHITYVVQCIKAFEFMAFIELSSHWNGEHEYRMYLLAYKFIIDLFIFTVILSHLKLPQIFHPRFDTVCSNHFIFFFFYFSSSNLSFRWLFCVLLANGDTHIVGTITPSVFLKIRFIEWAIRIYCSLKPIEIANAILKHK